MNKHRKLPFLGIADNRTKTKCSNNLYSKKHGYREDRIRHNMNMTIHHYCLDLRHEHEKEI